MLKCPDDAPKYNRDLTEYVGLNTSKAIIQNLEKMQFEEIVEFKQSMEEILLFIFKDTVYH